MKRQVKFTISGATETADGIIPHITIGELICPVMLDIEPLARGGYGISLNDGGLPVPIRRAGRLLYALPGGGSFVGATETVKSAV